MRMIIQTLKIMVIAKLFLNTTFKLKESLTDVY